MHGPVIIPIMVLSHKRLCHFCELYSKAVRDYCFSEDLTAYSEASNLQTNVRQL